MRWNILRRSLKGLIVGAVGIAYLAGAPIVLTATLGALAFSFINRVRDKREKREADAASEEGMFSGKGRSVEKEWKISRLPLDVQISSRNGNEMSFKAAGIDGLIEGRRTADGEESFSVRLNDLAAAQRAQTLLAGRGMDVEVTHDGYGNYRVDCKNLFVANDVAKLLYEQKKVSVERKTTSVRQYLVSGFSSPEEAVDAFKADPSAGMLVNSYISNVDLVDGKRSFESSNGALLDNGYNGGRLPVGSFIVSVEDTDSLSGVLKVPAEVPDLKEYVLANFSSALSPSGVKSTSDVKDSTPLGMQRTIKLDNGEEVAVRKDAGNLGVYVVFDTLEEMVELLNEGSLRKGSYLAVSDSEPVVPKGKRALFLPLSDERIRNAVSLQSGLSQGELDRLHQLGLSDNDVMLSCMSHYLEKNASCNVVLSSSIDEETLRGCYLDGVRYSDIEERIVNCDRLPELSPERLEQWMKDTAEISMVRVEVDVQNSVLRITSSVNGDASVKMEERPLTSQDIKNLSQRGTISEVEMKDLLLQLHPDYFKTYADKKGKSLFADPLEAFIAGRQPTLAVSSEPKKTTKREVEKKVSKPARKRTNKLGL